MAKILVSTSSFDAAHNSALQNLQKAGHEVVFNPTGRRLSEAEVAQLLGNDVVGMIAGVEPLTRGVLESAAALRVISRCGMGMDNVDSAAARARHNLLYNTPDAPSSAVAELTVALMLDLLRNVSRSDRIIRAGQWQPLMGRQIEGQTVGIVGYGRIGKKVAALLCGFGAHLLVCDIREAATDDGVGFCRLETLLKDSNIVSLHLPYSTTTRHLIDERALALMKSDAFLVNTSRGGLVDEAALERALRADKLAGAALDCFEQEPYKGPLTDLPQVVLTAHMGSYARECRASMELEAATNLVQGLVAAGILESAMLKPI